MRTTIIAALVALAAAAPLAAQSAMPAPRQTLTFNPIGLGAGFYSAEYERAAGTNFTVSAGASYFTLGEENLDYTSGDLRVRYYPNQALEGFSVGVSGGMIRAGGTNGVTLGSTLEHAWLLGRNRNVAFSLGGGFKRVLLIDGNSPNITVFYPTLRSSFGLAF
jgi:hypothetical protein